MPRDGIPAIRDPRFISIAEADALYADSSPVMEVSLNGDARAYPLEILIWHEIVADVVGGVPVAVTFCPLCNTAITFDRTIAGTVYDFGVSGLLRNSDLIMYDSQTESLWQQIGGVAIVGDMVGARLTVLPSTIVAWGDFKAQYPEGIVLSRETGYARRYGANPYVGYDRIPKPPSSSAARSTSASAPWSASSRSTSPTTRWPTPSPCSPSGAPSRTSATAGRSWCSGPPA